ncbi:MAG: CHAT domain-containing protein [Chloroflexota bacterium]
MAKRFIKKAHVGAFIGALWEVDDKFALLFMKKFYHQLFQRVSIAEAFRRAKDVICNEQPWNSTWLAYLLYAYPLATVYKSDALAKPAKFPPYLK